MWNGEPLTNDERLEWFRREAETLVDLASGSHFDLPVPTCPGWTVSDVLGHVGGAHRWCLSVVAGGEGSGDTTTVTATASDLVLWLWNRLPDPRGRLEISGDRSVVARWQNLKI